MCRLHDSTAKRSPATSGQACSQLRWHCVSTLTAASFQQPPYRIGRIPEPWAWTWTDWECVGDQRWDDADSDLRTVYAAESVLACLVEVLAHSWPDSMVVPELDFIRVDVEDVDHFLTHSPSEVPMNTVAMTSRRERPSRSMRRTTIVSPARCDFNRCVTVFCDRLVATPLESTVPRTGGPPGREVV